jgi:hypothetical protein
VFLALRLSAFVHARPWLLRLVWPAVLAAPNQSLFGPACQHSQVRHAFAGSLALGLHAAVRAFSNSQVSLACFASCRYASLCHLCIAPNQPLMLAMQLRQTTPPNLPLNGRSNGVPPSLGHSRLFAHFLWPRLGVPPLASPLAIR